MKKIWLFFLLLLFVGGCAYQGKKAAEIACHGCNILVISIDTLRADHLGVYGYPRNTSPNIDRFAESNILFKNFFTVVPKTGPSMVSFFTGKYVNNHGYTRNRLKIKGNQNLLAEVLPKKFKKGAFVANFVLNKQWGFSAGFDHFENIASQKVLTNKAIDWLGENKRKRFFLWLHYIDPHGPYRPPDEFKGMFINDSYYDESKKVSLADPPSVEGYFNPKSYAIGIVPPYIRINDIDEVDYYIAEYDAEIYFIDKLVGEIIDYLDASGLMSNTLVIITADHGEGLGEHNFYFDHGEFVAEPNIHIPLIISHPNIKQNLVIDSIAQSTDLFPTILTQLGIRFNSEIDGVDLTDLFIEGKHNDAKREYIYSRTADEYPRFYETVRTKTGKLIKSGTGEYTFYDLVNDIFELNDIFDTLDPDQKQQFLDIMALEIFGQKERASNVEDTNLSKEALEQLKSLGYMN